MFTSCVADPIDQAPNLAPGWYLLPSEVGGLSEGEVLAIDVCGTPAAIWRLPGGPLGAIHRYCPHRGADLSQGSVISTDLRCAFHGWCWNDAGDITTIPEVAQLPIFRTQSWPTRVHDGRAWIRIGQNIEPHEDGAVGHEPEAFLDSLLPAGLIDLGVLDRGEHPDPRLFIENLFDTAHISALHGIERPDVHVVDFDRNPAFIELRQPASETTARIWLYSTSQILNHFRSPDLELWTHSTVMLGDPFQYDIRAFVPTDDRRTRRNARRWIEGHRAAVVQDHAVHSRLNARFARYWVPIDGPVRDYYRWIERVTAANGALGELNDE